jgi:uncharacterized protein (DUF849 family)
MQNISSSINNRDFNPEDVAHANTGICHHLMDGENAYARLVKRYHDLQQGIAPRRSVRRLTGEPESLDQALTEIATKLADYPRVEAHVSHGTCKCTTETVSYPR